jgi:hypothetical protein
MLMVDNLMDLTHLGYLHAKTVGGNPAAHIEAEMKTTRTPTGVREFRALVEERGGVVEELPKGAFKVSGTAVGAVLVTIEG